jgi:purine-binding chemotaxis protein CheW
MGGGMHETKAADGAVVDKQEFLTFRLGAEEYCIDILKVQEIRGYDTVTTIANTPAFIKGVINLRGYIVPIVDLRIKFNLSDVKYDAMTIAIILNLGNKMVGVVVDSVSDVVGVARAEIKAASHFAAIDTEFIASMTTTDNRMLIVVDIEKLMSSGELQLIDKVAA